MKIAAFVVVVLFMLLCVMFPEQREFMFAYALRAILETGAFLRDTIGSLVPRPLSP